MTARLLTGDVRAMLATLDADSIDCVVTSPPYWGLRDYGVAGQIGLEPTLGEHIATMIDVFDAVRRVMKPEASLWLNYGDCYATKPAGWSAKRYKEESTDDRTFRDKPFSTVGAIYAPEYEKTARNGAGDNLGHTSSAHGGRDTATRAGVLKPKDLCMIPNRLAIALQEAGWWVRSEIVWGKPNPMPDSSGKYRPSTAHEKIFMLSKSANCFYDAEAVAKPVSGNTHARVSQDVASQAGSLRAHGGAKTNGPMKAVVRRKETVDAPRPPGSSPHTGLTSADDKRRRGKGQRLDHVLTEDPSERETRYLRNYEPAPLTAWEIPTFGFSDAHFATFPPTLAELCILAGCPKGGVVLDPFGGAGTVGLVAEQIGRDSILIELNPDSVAIAARRIKGACGAVEGGDSRRGLAPLPLFKESA